MTLKPCNLHRDYAPGSGLPHIVTCDGRTVAAFLLDADREDYLDGRRRHGTVAVDGKRGEHP